MAVGWQGHQLYWKDATWRPLKGCTSQRDFLTLRIIGAGTGWRMIQLTGDSTPKAAELVMIRRLLTFCLFPSYPSYLVIPNPQLAAVGDVIKLVQTCMAHCMAHWMVRDLSVAVVKTQQCCEDVSNWRELWESLLLGYRFWEWLVSTHTYPTYLCEFPDQALFPEHFSEIWDYLRLTCATEALSIGWANKGCSTKRHHSRFMESKGLGISYPHLPTLPPLLYCNKPTGGC